MRPQTPALQVAVEPGGSGQGVQEVPQLETDVLDTHTPPQRWKPTAQTQRCVATLQTSFCEVHWAFVSHPTKQLPVASSQ